MQLFYRFSNEFVVSCSRDNYSSREPLSFEATIAVTFSVN